MAPIVIHIEQAAHRNPVAVAMQKRHGLVSKPMKDRRTPRQGARNRQRDYREERY